MSDRNAFVSLFLDRAGWGNATQKHLAGDASNRSYVRLHCDKNDETAVLMDAPPSRGETIQPFVNITNHLRDLGFSAPCILAQDKQHGLLLIEDLGDALFARLCIELPEQEHALYCEAVDVLIQLHQHQPPAGLLDYNPAVMAEYIAPAFEWYHPARMDDVAAELERVLTKYCIARSVMALRDFHAENLLWLPDRKGIKRVGLLDYQDAVMAHPSYDLVSLLEDSRRNVPTKIQNDMIARYIAATQVDMQMFRAAYAVQGAQRNLRILGVFARLCIVMGKPGYIDLLPRVWGYLKHDLSHPDLAKLNNLVFTTLPEPTPEILQNLKDKCASHQIP